MKSPPQGAPASLLLVHGAGSGPWVFDGWAASFPSLRVEAVDLQDGLDVAHASIDDYANAVVRRAGALPPPVALVGWSMGGLVVLVAARRAHAHSLVLLEASPPAEVQGLDPGVEPRPGAFDPELVYGPSPSGIRARPESELARGERKRGIPVPSLPCPALVVHGDDFPEERGRALARLYAAQELAFPGLDHWGLVRNPRVREAIAHLLGA